MSDEWQWVQIRGRCDVRTSGYGRNCWTQWLRFGELDVECRDMRLHHVLFDAGSFSYATELHAQLRPVDAIALKLAGVDCEFL